MSSRVKSISPTSRRFRTALGLAAFGVLSAIAGAQGLVRETLAPNGLRLWAFPDDGADRFVLSVLVGSGSRQEDSNGTGLAHLLEHVLLGSTHEWTHAESEDVLESLGATHNGITGHDTTIYYVECPAEEWRGAVRWLAMHLVDPVLSEEDLRTEQKIVYEELDLRQPHAGVVTFESELYPRHALGRSIGGNPRGIDDFDVDDLREYYDTHYTSGNMAVGFAGRVPVQECFDALTEAFAAVPASTEPSSLDPVRPVARRIALPRSGGGSGRMHTGHHLARESLEDVVASLILKHYLADRAFQVIREENQLSYAPSVYLAQHADTARLEFMVAVSDHHNLPVVENLYEGLLRELATPNEETFEAARARALGMFEVDGAESLTEAIEVCWWGRRFDATPTAVQSALVAYTPERLGSFSQERLVDANRYVFANAPLGGAGPWAPIVALLLVVLAVDFFRGFPWLHATRARVRRLRLRPKRAAAGGESIVPVSADELERSIQDFYEQQEDDR